MVIMRLIRAEGFDRSYQTLTGHLREVRGPSRLRGIGTTAKQNSPKRCGTGGGLSGAYCRGATTPAS